MLSQKDNGVNTYDMQNETKDSGEKFSLKDCTGKTLTPEQAEADPIMVFNSDTDKGTTSKGVPRSLVALTTIKSERGYEVVAAIHLNKAQGFTEINDIASVYSKTDELSGKNRIADFINAQLAAENLRYINKNKSDEWLRRGGLQLPSLNTIIASNNNILHKEDIVNTYSMQNEKKDSKEKYSLKDSTGKTLTPEQAEFFKDSKVKDEDGNLLVVYHGTTEQFTVFDKTKGRSNMDIQGSFFSPWELDTRGYGGNVGE